ncbi:MAG: hypothetical protein K6E19_05795 [Lachnospiraceae bacterium]|nr:hypothetical protein [Lachnospiraceae bacterium]
MEIRFLGTGGADWPDAPAHEGDFFRHHASIIINNTILLDPGPGIYEYARTLPGVNMEGITDIFVTHTHEDHWSTDTLDSILKNAKEKVRLFFHYSAKVNLNLSRETKWGKGLSRESLSKLILCPMKRGGRAKAGNLTFLNLEANHIGEHGERGSHYVITGETETWFYGCDGGWFTTATWDVLRTLSFDGVILDGTVGEDSGNFRIAGHNTLAMNKLLAGAMKEQGMLKPGTKLYLSHFGMTTYDRGTDITETVKQAGFLEARDGKYA